MSKWAKVNLENADIITEIIDYDPEGIINENFLPYFIPCPDEVEKGYWYDPKKKRFYLPNDYAKHPDFKTFGYVNKGDCKVDKDGFIIFADN